MQTKNIYETVFIINALLEDAAIESLIEKTKEFITANEGGIQAVEKWGRRRLAYPIKKKHNGFYVLIEFQSTGNLVAKLERYFQLEAEIIRSLVIRLDKKALKVFDTLGKQELSYLFNDFYNNFESLSWSSTSVFFDVFRSVSVPR